MNRDLLRSLRRKAGLMKMPLPRVISYGTEHVPEGWDPDRFPLGVPHTIEFYVEQDNEVNSGTDSAAYEEGL